MRTANTMHPSEAELILFVEAKLLPERHERLVRHLADCAFCVSQIAAIHHFSKDLDVGTVPSIDRAVFERASALIKKKGRFFLLREPFRYAVAAMVVVGIGVGFLVLRNRTEVAQFRGGGASETTMTTSPPDESVVTSLLPRLEWKAIPNANSYRIILYEENGKMLWSTVTDATSTGVPSTVPMTKGNRYLWKVEAFFPDNSKLSSRLNVFTYDP